MKDEQICCSICNNLTAENPCCYCVSTTRDRSQICVVETDSHILGVEKTRRYTGLYHVLHGALAPAHGIGPDKLMLANLLPRLMPQNDDGVKIKEIVVAVNSKTKDETTANYIERLLRPLDIKTSRIEIETED